MHLKYVCIAEKTADLREQIDVQKCEEKYEV